MPNGKLWRYGAKPGCSGTKDLMVLIINTAN